MIGDQSKMHTCPVSAAGPNFLVALMSDGTSDPTMVPGSVKTPSADLDGSLTPVAELGDSAKYSNAALDDKVKTAQSDHGGSSKYSK